MRQYQLSECVYVCVDDGYVVFLDLQRDRYFSMEAAATGALGRVVPGWPVPAAEPGGTARAEDLAESLRRRGLLLESGACRGGKPATPVSIQPPLRELLPERAHPEAEEASHSAALSFGTAAAFLMAAMSAKLRLKLLAFDRVIENVRQRKSLQRNIVTPLDLRRARALVAAHARLRVFLFSSKEECLYDSLSLLEFLALHGVFPDWVFGVRARPFAAHCWVQYESTVFNDTVEHVGGYQPIMLV